MKWLLMIFAGFLITSTLYGQQVYNGNQIPDSIRRRIVSDLSTAILRYRVDYNPALKESDKIFKKVGNETWYKSPSWILFEESEEYGTVELLLDLTRWPEDNPLPNYYLATKWGNRFAVKYIHPLYGKTTDTIRSARYDSYNNYFPNDERFLVYYDDKEGIIKFMSGNFFQSGINGPWFKYGTTLIPEIRLAQYPVGEPTNFIDKGDTTIFVMPHARAITGDDPGVILVKAINKYPYNYMEIIYYSNRASQTGDNNNTHFYEIKQIRDYSRGYPYTPQDLKPIVRLLSPEEIAALEVYYHQPIYKFGSIDDSGIPAKR